MSIAERAQKVLVEIDAALAMAEKATKGPWVRDGYDIKQPGRRQIAYVGPHHTPPHDYPLSCKMEDERNGDGIAASRTLLPASLRCLKTAIEGLLFMETRFICTPLDRMALTTLCDQWDARKEQP